MLRLDCIALCAAALALTMPVSGYTKGCGSLPPEKALKCENCQTQCNNSYQNKLLKGGTPDQVAIWRKEHTQCLQSCLTK